MDQNNYSGELQDCLWRHQEELMDDIIAYHELMNRYAAAIKEVTTKLEILKDDLRLHNHRDCVCAIQSRIKSPVSIVNKLKRKQAPITFQSIRSELNDVAGIRVICSFIDDIYNLADKLSSQDDIVVVRVKDYIRNPKENGYRSYHMIVEVPVFFADKKEILRVEIQIRTVAMDFWASLEHDMKYKNANCCGAQIVHELKECADTIAETDQRMMDLRNRLL